MRSSGLMGYTGATASTTCTNSCGQMSKPAHILTRALTVLLLITGASCDNDKATDSKFSNSPTSGDLVVYYDAALQHHIQNQAYTFQRLYTRANLTLTASSEDRAVKALYENDCESIVITRPLNEKEQKAFASKKFAPRYSVLASSGMALLVNKNLPLKNLTYAEVLALLRSNISLVDSSGRTFSPDLFIDNNGSALSRYVLDSLLRGGSFPPHLHLLASANDVFQALRDRPRAIGIIDFAWISDRDDSLYKAFDKEFRLLAIGARVPNGRYEPPNQSSFKTRAYPFSRQIYVYRKTGEFTLAKGFESFMAGPKGQTIFLKQGLLPSRQQERSVHINLEPMSIPEP